MSDVKIHIKEKKATLNEQGCVKLDKEARGMISALMTQTGHDAKYLASEIIKQAISKNLVVFDKEGD